MSDLFHEKVPDEFIDSVVSTMRKADWHQYQILTKRAERLVALDGVIDWPANAIVGVTVELGRGNLTRPDVEKMMTSFSELPAHFTAPPSGLFLEKVLYEGDKLPPVTPPICLL